MPVFDALVIAAIVAAFLVFAVVLAWGERQTRNLRQPFWNEGDTGHGPAAKVEAKNVRTKEAA